MAEPQDIIAIGPDGVENHFPLGTTDAQISAALGAIPEANKAAMPSAPTWKALAMQGAAKAAPLAADATMAAATSPTFAKTLGAITRHGTTLAEVAHGIAAGNPQEVIMAPVAGWSAGKGGYWLGKGIQAAAAPMARVASAVAPYVQALSTVSGAQGVNDLAQMAEPNRTDIGVLGMGSSNNTTEQKATVMRSQIQNLVNSGLSLNDAIRRVSDAWRPR